MLGQLATISCYATQSCARAGHGCQSERRDPDVSKPHLVVMRSVTCLSPLRTRTDPAARDRRTTCGGLRSARASHRTASTSHPPTRCLGGRSVDLLSPHYRAVRFTVVGGGHSFSWIRTVGRSGRDAPMSWAVTGNPDRSSSDVERVSGTYRAQALDNAEVMTARYRSGL